MPDVTIPNHDSLFRRTLEECRDLYVSSATLCARTSAAVAARQGEEGALGEQFVALMDDLHRALVLKVYFSVVEADQKWSSRERFLAEELFDHLWGTRLTGEELRTAARRLSEDAATLKWYSIVRPFDQIVPLRERVGTLETLVMRLANLVARADGELGANEAGVIKSIQEELRSHLRPIPIDEPNGARDDRGDRCAGVREAQGGSGGYLSSVTGQDGRILSVARSRRTDWMSRPPSAPSLAEALAELDALDRSRHGEARGPHAHELLEAAAAARRGRPAGHRHQPAHGLHRQPGHRQDDRRRHRRQDLWRDGHPQEGPPHRDRSQSGLVAEYAGPDGAEDATRRSTKRSTACCSSTKPTASRARRRRIPTATRRCRRFSSEPRTIASGSS